MKKINLKDLLKTTKKIPYITGKHGEGKTTFIKDFAKNEKLNLTILNLSAIESSDFTGLPQIIDNTTVYSKPSFLNAELLFLDEIDRVQDRQVKACLLSLIVDRKINGHEFKGHLISAGNGQNSENYDTSEFDDALNDRLIPIHFEYTLNEKLDYFSKKYRGHDFLEFLENTPELFDTFSSRTIEAYFEVNNTDCMEYVLNYNTLIAYKDFKNENSLSLKDISNNFENINFKNISPIARTAVVRQVLKELYNLDTYNIENINKFTQLLSAEEKSLYFSGLKEMALKDGENFKNKIVELNLKGLFKGQKQYLIELV